MLWAIIGGFTLLLALNIPVAYAMLATSIGYLIWNGTIPFIVVAQQLGAGTDQFLLLAIPFFFLAGEFMAHGGIIQRLVDLARAMVGHFAGGLGITLSFWADDASALLWRDHPEHKAIRDAGRDRWYRSYEVIVCEAQRSYAWEKR